MRTIEKLSLKFKCFRREESGSLIVFSLFLFVLILMIAGMAVDIMRHEQRRVALQNTIDSAVVAASSINQDLDAEAIIRDHVTKAGFDASDVQFTSSQSDVNGRVTGRSVSAVANFSVDTLFMGFMDIPELHGLAGGRAEEGTQFFEISLVLDISGSMRGTKLERLKVAAKDFVTKILANNGVDNVTISIVPYNQHVLMSGALRSRINTANDIIEITDTTHSGQITAYNTVNPRSLCAVFEPNDFDTRRLVSTTNSFGGRVNLAGAWSNRNVTDFGTPADSNTYCVEDRQPGILAFENRENILHTHIDGLSAGGWTAVDLGMKWGTALLDPMFRPIVEDMVDNTVLEEAARSHPVDYGRNDVRKLVVLMTDGINTRKYDLKPEFKSGPTRIWHSETLADGEEFDGFLVEMPENDADERWYVPGSPFDSDDDYFLADTDLPSDARQWDHHALYARFEMEDIPEYFFQEDNDAFDAYDDVETNAGGDATADAHLRRICDAAKVRKEIEVYTVAFKAPDAAEDLLEYCATAAGYHFDVDGDQISDAFNAIASQITELRLTE